MSKVTKATIVATPTEDGFAASAEFEFDDKDSLKVDDLTKYVSPSDNADVQRALSMIFNTATAKAV